MPIDRAVQEDRAQCEPDGTIHRTFERHIDRPVVALIRRAGEIDSEIADHPRSTILDQVTNGLAVRMAVMFLVSGGKTLPEPGE